jgi:hypothetical protein
MSEPVSESGLPTKEEWRETLAKIEVLQENVQNRLTDPDLPTKEEWQQAKAEMAELREYSKDNRHRIKNNRALCVLVAVVSPLFLFSVLFSVNITFGEKLSGNFQSREIKLSDLVPILGLAGTALGVVGADEIAGFLKKSKE